MGKDETPLLNVQKASIFLGVNVNTIRRWAKSGKLKGIKVGSRGDWRFTKDKLLKLVKSEPEISDTKTIYSKIKRFLKANANDLQKLATKHHKILLETATLRTEFLHKYQKFHIKVLKLLAANLDDTEKGITVFKKLGEQFAKEAVKDKLTIEEAVDGTIFLKEAVWEKLEQSGLLNELTTQDFNRLSKIMAAYIDVLASKIAFTYHEFYTQQLEKDKEDAKTTQERMYKIFMEAPIPIAILKGKDLVYELSNPANNTALGIDNPVGKSVKKLFPKNKKIFKLLESIYKTGKPFEGKEVPLILHVPGKGTQTIYANLQYQPLKGENNKIEGIITTGVDVTEQVEAKRKAERQKRLYEAVTASTPDLIYVFDLHYKITYANEALLQMWGKKTLHDVRGKRLRELGYEEWQAKMHEREINQIIATKKQVRGTVSFPHAILGKRIYDYIFTPILDTKGEVEAIAGITRDITDLKQTEKNISFLSEASRLLSSSLEYKTTLQNVAKLAVPEIADWCSVSLKTDIGIEQVAIAHIDPKQVKWAKELNKKNPPDPNAKTGIPNILRTGKSEYYPNITDEMLVAAAKDAEQLALLRKLHITSAMTVPMRIGKEIIGAISFVSAESERHYTKADLAIAESLGVRAGIAIQNARLYSDAQKAIALRDEFISVASHELKTPVTSLKMYTQVMKSKLEREGNGFSTRPLTKMDEQIERLTSLIGDLLSVSRVQAGRLEFLNELFDLNDVVKDVIENVQATAKKHKIFIEGNIKKLVYGDKDRIGQVIINLVTNAIKYSPNADKVIVHLASEKDVAVVSVQDFGIGIDKDHQKRIFERFYRVSNAEEKTFPGLGLGLYIAYQIIKRHDGEMEVVSIKGKGSKFSFTLPYKAAGEEK